LPPWARLQHFSALGSPFSVAAAVALFAPATRLRVLRATVHNAADEIALEDLAVLANRQAWPLSMLSVSCEWHVAPETWTSVARAVPMLRRLELRACWGLDDSTLHSILQTLPALESLWIEFCGTFTGAAFTTGIPALQQQGDGTCAESSFSGAPTPAHSLPPTPQKCSTSRLRSAFGVGDNPPSLMLSTDGRPAVGTFASLTEVASPKLGVPPLHSSDATFQSQPLDADVRVPSWEGASATRSTVLDAVPLTPPLGVVSRSVRAIALPGCRATFTADDLCGIADTLPKLRELSIPHVHLVGSAHAVVAALLLDGDSDGDRGPCMRHKALRVLRLPQGVLSESQVIALGKAGVAVGG
jgi:hypothetical protein